MATLGDLAEILGVDAYRHVRVRVSASFDGVAGSSSGPTIRRGL